MAIDIRSHYDSSARGARGEKLSLSIHPTLSPHPALPKPQEQSETRGVLQFFNMESVKAHLKEKFLTRKPGDRSPFLKIPSGWMKQLVREAFQKNPWCTAQGITIQVDEIEIPLSYWVFEAANRIEEFNSWYQEAIDSYLSDFNSVVEFIASPSFTNYGGWGRVKKWWPEIIKRAFIQSPFTALKKLKLTHNGHTINGPYQYATRDKNGDSLRVVKDAYEEIFTQYIERSWENAQQYVFREGAIKWELIPEKWHKKFLKMAHEQNPFTAPLYLHATHNGVKRQAPSSFYVRRKRHADLTEMMDEVENEYINSLDRVHEIIFSKEKFSHKGGWKRIPEKWRKIVVINAVSNDKRDNPTAKSLIYTRGKQSVFLEPLRKLYESEGREETFLGWMREGVKFREEVKLSKEKREVRKEKKLPNSSKDISFKWILPEITQEEAVALLKKAKEEKSEEIYFKVIQHYGFVIKKLVWQVEYEDSMLRQALVSDAIIIALDLVKAYTPERGATLKTFLFSFIKQKLWIYRTAHKKGISFKEANNANTAYHEVRRASEDDLDITQSPEEIAEQTGKSVVRVQTAQRGVRGSLSLNVKSQDGEGSELQDQIEDAGNSAPSHIVINKKTRGLVTEAISHLPGRDQVMIRQRFGIGRKHKISPFAAEKYFGSENSYDKVIEAVEGLVLKIEMFVHDPHIQCSPEALNQLASLIENARNPDEIAIGHSYLGKVLLGEKKAKMGVVTVLQLLVEEMDSSHAIILSEIFQLEPKVHTLQSIGNLFQVSRERIRQIEKRTIDKLEEILKTEFNIHSLDILIYEN